MSKIIEDYKICNFYCDESCHTKNDGFDFIVLSSIYCRKTNLSKVKKDIISIKKKYDLNFDDEIKWNKITIHNVELYKEIIQYVSDTSQIRIRTLIGNEKIKTLLPYDEWYHSMYYFLFKKMIEQYSYDFNEYHLLIDKKDSNSNMMYKNTALFLSRKFNNTYKILAEPVDSKEHQLVQIADIFAGAISYKKRGLTSNTAKNEIVELICSLFKTDLVSSTSLYSDNYKFSNFSWHGDF